LVLASGESVRLLVRVAMHLLLLEHLLPRGPTPTTAPLLAVPPDLPLLAVSPAGENVRLLSRRPVVAEPILDLPPLRLASRLEVVRHPWIEAALAALRMIESSLPLLLRSPSLRHEQLASGFLLT
jgi:hypothetical protein